MSLIIQNLKRPTFNRTFQTVLFRTYVGYKKKKTKGNLLKTRSKFDC